VFPQRFKSRGIDSPGERNAPVDGREEVQRREEAMASMAELHGPEAEFTKATTVWIFVGTRYR